METILGKAKKKSPACTIIIFLNAFVTTATRRWTTENKK